MAHLETEDMTQLVLIQSVKRDKGALADVTAMANAWIKEHPCHDIRGSEVVLTYGDTYIQLRVYGSPLE